MRCGVVDRHHPDDSASGWATHVPVLVVHDYDMLTYYAVAVFGFVAGVLVAGLLQSARERLREREDAAIEAMWEMSR